MISRLFHEFTNIINRDVGTSARHLFGYVSGSETVGNVAQY